MKKYTKIKKLKAGGWFGSKVKPPHGHPPVPHGHISVHPMHEPHSHYDPSKGHIPFHQEHHGAYDPKIHGAFHPEHHGTFDPKIHGAFHQDLHGTFDPTKHGTYDSNIHGQIIHSPHLQSIQSHLTQHHMDLQTKQSILNKLKIVQSHQGKELTPNQSQSHKNALSALQHLKLGKGPIKNSHIQKATLNLNSARQKILQYGISQKLIKPEHNSSHHNTKQLVTSLQNKLMGWQKEHDTEKQRLASTPFAKLQALNTRQRPTNSLVVGNTPKLEPSSDQKQLLQNIQNKNKGIITAHGLNKEPDIQTKLRRNVDNAQTGIEAFHLHGVPMTNEQKKKLVQVHTNARKKLSTFENANTQEGREWNAKQLGINMSKPQSAPYKSEYKDEYPVNMHKRNPVSNVSHSENYSADRKLQLDREKEFITSQHNPLDSSKTTNGVDLVELSRKENSESHLQTLHPLPLSSLPPSLSPPSSPPSSSPTSVLEKATIEHLQQQSVPESVTSKALEHQESQKEPIQQHVNLQKKLTMSEQPTESEVNSNNAHNVTTNLNLKKPVQPQNILELPVATIQHNESDVNLHQNQTTIPSVNQVRKLQNLVPKQVKPPTEKHYDDIMFAMDKNKQGHIQDILSGRKNNIVKQITNPDLGLEPEQQKAILNHISFQKQQAKTQANEQLKKESENKIKAQEKAKLDYEQQRASAPMSTFEQNHNKYKQQQAHTLEEQAFMLKHQKLSNSDYLLKHKKEFGHNNNTSLNSIFTKRRAIEQQQKNNAYKNFHKKYEYSNINTFVSKYKKKFGNAPIEDIKKQRVNLATQLNQQKKNGIPVNTKKQKFTISAPTNARIISQAPSSYPIASIAPSPVPELHSTLPASPELHSQQPVASTVSASPLVSASPELHSQQSVASTIASPSPSLSVQASSVEAPLQKALPSDQSTSQQSVQAPNSKLPSKSLPGNKSIDQGHIRGASGVEYPIGTTKEYIDEQEAHLAKQTQNQTQKTPTTPTPTSTSTSTSTMQNPAISETHMISPLDLQRRIDSKLTQQNRSNLKGVVKNALGISKLSKLNKNHQINISKLNANTKKRLGFSLPQAPEPIQSPQAQSPQAQTPQAQTPQAQTPRAQTPQAQTPQAQTPIQSPQVLYPPQQSALYPPTGQQVLYPPQQSALYPPTGHQVLYPPQQSALYQPTGHQVLYPPQQSALYPPTGHQVLYPPQQSALYPPTGHQVLYPPQHSALYPPQQATTPYSLQRPTGQYPSQQATAPYSLQKPTGQYQTPQYQQRQQQYQQRQQQLSNRKTMITKLKGNKNFKKTIKKALGIKKLKSLKTMNNATLRQKLSQELSPENYQKFMQLKNPYGGIQVQQPPTVYSGQQGYQTTPQTQGYPGQQVIPTQQRQSTTGKKSGSSSIPRILTPVPKYSPGISIV